MIWEIEFRESALKALKKLNRQDATRIIAFLSDRVAADENPRRTGQALQGSELGNFWRYRVGDYRIVCDIQDNRVVIIVVDVGHRKEIYR
ncbi:type II toxin-antitoxin system RelE/ParE family toxin [uncultured Agrobacterium sp.]|uniref:type II toxin-antitoxin system RelE family toxin n=1 Tax=uncultured Agrobacterium sp. TaxID=157277 RepID=UPI00258E9D3E|nr:type II toxin-antitoxin system RelE/ParE family toxin [uncultured Agrobacterium sp.]